MGNKNKSKEKVILVFTENKTGKMGVTKHIPITIKKEKYVLYPVNFPVMYLSLTEMSLKSVINTKEENLEKLKFDINLLGSQHKNVFHYSNLILSSISVFIVNAAICLEAYSNIFVDKDSEVKIEDKIFNWADIQRKLSVMTKLDELVNTKTRLNFKKSYPNEWNQIDNLIKLRNNIVHTKVELNNGSIFKYKKLINSMLNFDCELTFIALKSLIKFYTPNLLMET